MKLRFASAAFALVAAPLALRAADSAPTGWHAQTLGQALAYMILFSGIGIIAAIAGYKLFDKCTPGLLKQLARGSYIREVLFDWQTSGGTRAVFMKIKLEELPWRP